MAKKPAKDKPERGRPSKYDPKYAEQARKLCLLGATDEELAGFFDVSVATIDNWKNAHADFLGALKAGKAQADAEVADKLYQRALGYSHPEDKIFNDSGEPLIVPTTKHYPPDTAAAFIWLKNRQGARWKDKQEFEHNISDDLAALLDARRKKTDAS
ncbi:hypothetical protein [Hyphomonas sp. CY54-11-8]|uniref:hypothetical protein n=1 Tax=Hyphomonas sp. CY54-11-8 TaxID=1280944 RepID=UPI000458CDEE|nr:hypothetical protein [Hyphomonas sp. CY54-11-8]KCZ47562.1 transposase [Hyphomonas sp. CY54-11-8]